MSEIHTTRVLSGRLEISQEGVEFLEKNQEGVPEMYPYAIKGQSGALYLTETTFRWHGIGVYDPSGYREGDAAIRELASYTKGKMDIVLIGDYGDMYGIRIQDGVVTYPDVRLELAD